jgi:ferredoxin
MDADSPKISHVQNLCRNCGLCVQSCPRKAISPWTPAPFIPAARWLLSQESLQRLVSPCAFLSPSCNHALQPLCDCLPVFQIRGLCKGLKNLLYFLKCGEPIVCEKSEEKCELFIFRCIFCRSPRLFLQFLHRGEEDDFLD